MSKKNEGIVNIVWRAAGNWGRQLISFVVFAILARLLEPTAFGMVAQANIFIMFINMFATQGFGMAIIQRKGLEKSHLDTAFWVALGSGLALAAATLLGCGFIASFLGEPALKPYVAVLALDSIFESLIVVQSAIMMRDMQFKKLTVRTLIALVSGGLAGIAMAGLGFGAWSLVAQTVVTAFVAFVATWPACSYRPGIQVSWKALRELWNYSWAILASNFMNFASTRSDQYLIGRAIGSDSLGFYSIGQKVIALLTGGLTEPVSTVSLTILTREQDDKEKVARTVYHGIEMAALICYPIFFGLICLAPEMIVLVFGQKWLASGNLLRIFVCSEIINVVLMFNYPVFLSLGKPKYNFFFLMFKAVGTAGAALIGLKWGVYGVAIGVVANTVLNSGISVVFLRRLLPISPVKMLRSAALPFLFSSIMAAAVMAARYFLPRALPVWAAVGVCVAAGAAVYAGSLSLLSKRLFNEALDYVRSFLKIKPKAAKESD